MPHTILRLPTVKARTGLSRSTIYHRVSCGTFPAPVPLGGVGARMRAGLRASNRRARHLPMRSETGLPSSVIRFRT